ncbi:MAG: rod shape-determining protein MreC [Bacteroidales bacterium]|nr:rod shape-determining protein MreC [Bacteroidales bacterium]
MRNLIDFFVRNSAWFVFIFYMILSSILLFNNNPYQHSVYLTSANIVVSSIYDKINSVTSYFYLRDINEDLQKRNAALELEVLALREIVKDYKAQSMDSIQSPQSQYDYILSRVISNSISLQHNYITINKGTEDGVVSEMGVVDQNGVVGIVNVMGKKSSRVISLLNPNLRLSCKVKGSDYFGSLVWDGKSPNYAILEEMPRHVEFEKGDTIVTSGYSAVFPEGLNVGVIENQLTSGGDNFYSLRVRLLSDFSHLSTVRLIKNNMKEEYDALKNMDFENRKEGKK